MLASAPDREAILPYVKVFQTLLRYALPGRCLVQAVLLYSLGRGLSYAVELPVHGLTKKVQKEAERFAFLLSKPGFCSHFPSDLCPGVVPF